MSDANKELVRRCVEALNNEGSAAVDRFFATDWIGWDSRDNSQSNRQDLKKEIDVVLSGFPDSRATIEDLVAEGDKVVSRSTETGTHTQESALYGKPTGKRLAVKVISIDRIANNKIVETWTEASGLGFYYQLTGKPAPSLKEQAARR